jgi:hypothetical protein
MEMKFTLRNTSEDLKFAKSEILESTSSDKIIYIFWWRIIVQNVNT